MTPEQPDVTDVVDAPNGGSLQPVVSLPRPYYQDASVTLYNADALQILPALSPAMFGVMVSDPPYGVKHQSGSRGNEWWQGVMIHGDRDTTQRDAALLWWGDRPALIFGSHKAPKPTSTRMTLIWDKGPALGMGALDIPWKPSWEEIYVIGKGWQGRRDGGVLSYSPVQSMARNGRVHPHEKPLSLISYLLTKCPAGGIIDPFVGSGTTLRAAKDAGRTIVGIEIDERHCETAARKCQQEVLLAG